MAMFMPFLATTPSWGNYYEITRSINMPRPALLWALESLKYEQGQEKFALDLGCGTGRDTLYLLEKGWTVIALDNEPAALLNLVEKFAALEEGTQKLIPYVGNFETDPFPQNLQLINASYAIPFCHPQYFADVWQKIINSLDLNGRFVGQFFGPQDSWSNNSNMTFHSKEDLLKLLEPHFIIEYWGEENRDGFTKEGEFKHWQVFHVVATKKSIF